MGPLTALCLTAALICGQPETGDRKDLEQAVRPLLRDLDGGELARRDAAEAKLLELGPAILDLLPDGGPRQSAEVRQRLDRLRAKLERARAEAFVQSSRITLAEQTYRLSELFAAIERQTGNKFLDYREEFGQESPDLEIKVGFEKAPFWQAVDELLDRAGLTVYPYAEQSALAIVAGTASQAPRSKRASYAGAFRIEATQLIAERDLRDPSKHSLALDIEAAWEPRLAPIALRQSLADLQAVDAKGTMLAAQPEEMDLEAPINAGSLATSLRIPFAPPDRSVPTISLKGKMTALLPGRVETYQFTDLAKARNVEQAKAGAIVTLDQARKNNELWEIRLRVRFAKDAGALESHRGWIFNNEAYLVGADEKRLSPDGFETTSQSEDEVGMAYLFDVASLDGLTFVYKTPAVLLNIPLEYELKDLELP